MGTAVRAFPAVPPRPFVHSRRRGGLANIDRRRRRTAGRNSGFDAMDLDEFNRRIKRLTRRPPPAGNPGTVPSGLRSSAPAGSLSRPQPSSTPGTCPSFPLGVLQVVVGTAVRAPQHCHPARSSVPQVEGARAKAQGGELRPSPFRGDGAGNECNDAQFSRTTNVQYFRAIDDTRIRGSALGGPLDSMSRTHWGVGDSSARWR